MNNTVVLTPEALKWLGSGFENKTKLSPFSTAPDADFTQAGLDALVKQGIVEEDKTITTGAYAVLETLAAAGKFASVHLSGSCGHVNRTTYWNGDKSVSLDNGGNTISVTPGNQVIGLEVILNEITGVNRLMSSDFSAVFDHRSALVFAGLFDLYRMATMRFYADDKPEPDGFSVRDVSEFIGAAEDPKWLTSHIKALNIPKMKITDKEAAAGLKSLAGAGIIAENKDNLFKPALDSAELAANFLFIENIVHFKAGSEKDSKINIVERMYLQAGVHDVISVDVSSEKIEISAVSSFDMVDTICKLMTTPPSF